MSEPRKYQTQQTVQNQHQYTGYWLGKSKVVSTQILKNKNDKISGFLCCSLAWSLMRVYLRNKSMLTLVDMDWVRLELKAWHVKVSLRSRRVNFVINRSLRTVFSDVTVKLSSMIWPLRHHTNCGNGLPIQCKFIKTMKLTHINDTMNYKK